MKTSLALIVAATSIFVFTQAADAQWMSANYVVLRAGSDDDCLLRSDDDCLLRSDDCLLRSDDDYYLLRSRRRLPTTLRQLPTTLRPLLTIQLRRITPQPRHTTGAVAITAVVITAATIAADCSALAWAVGPVFVESTEGGIVAGGN